MKRPGVSEARLLDRTPPTLTRTDTEQTRRGVPQTTRRCWFFITPPALSLLSPLASRLSSLCSLLVSLCSLLPSPLLSSLVSRLSSLVSQHVYYSNTLQREVGAPVMNEVAQQDWTAEPLQRNRHTACELMDAASAKATRDDDDVLPLPQQQPPFLTAKVEPLTPAMMLSQPAERPRTSSSSRRVSLAALTPRTLSQRGSELAKVAMM